MQTRGDTEYHKYENTYLKQIHVTKYHTAIENRTSGEKHKNKKIILKVKSISIRYDNNNNNGKSIRSKYFTEHDTFLLCPNRLVD